MCSTIALVHNVPRAVLLEHCIGVLPVDRCVQQTTRTVSLQLAAPEAARLATMTAGSRSMPSAM
jgi:hypothetical protein